MFEVKRQLIAPPSPVITPEELAAHLRIAEPGESDLSELLPFIQAAADGVQGYLKRPLAPQVWKFFWPAGTAETEIAFSPVIEILDTSNAEGFLVKTARVGYETVPPSLLLAVKLLAADLYEHRESQAETSLSENRSFRFLLANYKQEFAY